MMSTFTNEFNLIKLHRITMHVYIKTKHPAYEVSGFVPVIQANRRMNFEDEFRG